MASLASAKLTQHVVLFIGQALLDGRCDHKVIPTHAGLAHSVLYAAGPT